jgi:hypothetical protein
MCSATADRNLRFSYKIIINIQLLIDMRYYKYINLRQKSNNVKVLFLMLHIIKYYISSLSLLNK